MPVSKSTVELNEDQEAESQRIYEPLRGAFDIAGVQTSFAQSAEGTLPKLCGLRLSESTVERVTEAAGERVAKLLTDKKTFGENKRWQWQRDARGKTCPYVGLDEGMGHPLDNTNKGRHEEDVQCPATWRPLRALARLPSALQSWAQEMHISPDDLSHLLTGQFGPPCRWVSTD